MTKINTNCPNCKAGFKIDEVHIGKNTRCKNCGERFVVLRSQESNIIASCDAQIQIEATQPAKSKISQPIKATVRQDVSLGFAKTIPSPKAKQTDDDIAATIAAQKDAAEIQREEQEVPVEWEEGQTILDLYEVKQVFRTGGMGLVYKVHHKNWNVDLAVKSPRAEFFKTEAQKQDFIKECETWINLGLHPNIVSCYYVRTLSGIPRVFAEYVEGGSLKDWIESKKLYEGGKEKALERILDIAIQFAWGLHYAHEHEQKLIHQDVKPANVMMTEDGTVKVTDFGLAKARAVAGEAIAVSSQQSILVSSGGMTPAYCSPEQANKQKLSRKTDIWSWGLSVLEMFAGEVFWRAGQAAPEALDSYLEGDPEDESIPGMPKAIVELLRLCFQRNPKDRPKDMQEITARLETIYKDVIGNDYIHPEPKPAELLADSLNNKAVSMLDLGKKEDAERLYEEALKADPHHPEATYNRGLLLWRSGRMTDDELLRRLKEIQKSDKENWITGYLLGLTHLERDDCESAIEAIEDTRCWAKGKAELASVIKTARARLERSRRLLRSLDVHKRVNSVHFSKNGKYVLSGNDDGTVQLWDLETGKCVRTMSGHRDQALSVALSGDGRYGLSGGGYDDKKIKLWDVSTGQCLRTFEGHTSAVYAVSLSSGGHFALSGSYDATIRLWENGTGRCVWYYSGLDGGVISVFLNKDGRYVLAGGEFGLKLFDLKTVNMTTGQPSLRMFEKNKHIHCAVLSRDNRLILWGGGSQGGGMLELCDISTGNCLRRFKGHSHMVNSVCLRGDGQYGLSGSVDGTFRIWDVSTGRCLRTFRKHKDFVKSVFFSADGKYALSAGSDGTIKYWQVFSDENFFSAPLVLCKAVNSKIATSIGKAYRQALMEAERNMNNEDAIGAVRWVRQARSLSGYGRASGAINKWANLYTLLQKKDIKNIWQLGTLGRQSRNACVTTDCSARHALSATYGGGMVLWDLNTREQLRAFGGGVISLCMSMDGRYAVSGGNDAKVTLYEISTGRCLRTFEGHNNNVQAVCMNSNNRYILSGGWDNIVKLWDISTGRCVRTFKEDSNLLSKGNDSASSRVYAVTFSRNERHVLSGDWDGKIRIWDIVSGCCLRTINAHRSGLKSLCLSEDGRFALTASNDIYEHTIKLWDAGTWQCKCTLKSHTRGVNSVCLSSDGRYALSGSTDQMVKLWDLETGKCLRTLEGHTAPILSVCISRDFRYALSAGNDEGIKLWFLDWELEERRLADWDEGARPYIEVFMRLHRRYGADGLSRGGKPTWNEEDFKQLLYTLGCVGYGWLRPEGVRKKLEELTANWQGPPPLPGQQITRLE